MHQVLHTNYTGLLISNKQFASFLLVVVVREKHLARRVLPGNAGGRGQLEQRWRQTVKYVQESVPFLLRHAAPQRGHKHARFKHRGRALPKSLHRPRRKDGGREASLRTWTTAPSAASSSGGMAASSYMPGDGTFVTYAMRYLWLCLGIWMLCIAHRWKC